jgi:glycerol-3-phosphate O-acyltransferase
VLLKSDLEDLDLDFAQLHEPLKHNFQEFVECYLSLAQSQGFCDIRAKSAMKNLYNAIVEQIDSPFPFQSVHKINSDPCPYYDLGLEIARPLVRDAIIQENPEILHEVKKALEAGENVIFAANHQTELEPQILSLACDQIEKDFFKNTFFVAGERVTTDPIAAPLSRGRNLFCIYAKRYVSDNKEEEIDRRMHNLKTIKQIKELLNKGGICIYVALGGGRDRPDADQMVQLTKFDPSSVGLFTLLAQTAKRPTHIYPLVIESFNVLPPPVNIQKALGERRWTGGGDVRVKFGERFNYGHYLYDVDKELQNQILSDALFLRLQALYTPFKANVAPQKY